MQVCNYKSSKRFFSPPESAVAHIKTLILEKMAFLDKSLAAVEETKRQYSSLKLTQPTTESDFLKLGNLLDEFSKNLNESEPTCKEVNQLYKANKIFFSQEFQDQHAVASSALQARINGLISFFHAEDEFLQGDDDTLALSAADPSSDLEDESRRMKI